MNISSVNVKSAQTMNPPTLTILSLVIFLFAMIWETSYAYELLLNDNTYGTSTSFSGSALVDDTDYFKYQIDCGGLGWSEISGIGWSGYGYTSVGNVWMIIDTKKGSATSTNMYDPADNAGFNWYFTFSPAVWCENDRINVRISNYPAHTGNLIFHPHQFNSGFDAQNYDALPGAWILCEVEGAESGSQCGRTAGTRGADIKSVIWGSYSTSTGDSGGCTDCLTGNQEIMEDGINLIASVGVVGLSALFLVGGIITSIWAIRRYWR